MESYLYIYKKVKDLQDVIIETHYNWTPTDNGYITNILWYFTDQMIYQQIKNELINKTD